MFNKDDEVIEYLEKTMELYIPKEILNNQKDTINYIEDKLNIDIPHDVTKKKKIQQFLAKTNKDFNNFFIQRRFLDKLKFFLFISLFLAPLLFLMYYIAISSDYIFLNKFSLVLLISFFILIIAIIILGISVFKIQRKYELKWLKRDTVFYSFLIVPIVIILGITYMFYWNNEFQISFIRNVMSTRNHQYLANIFYKRAIIESAMTDGVKIVDSNNEQLYEFTPIEFNVNNYANSYDKEILTRENSDDVYKIIKVEGTLRDGVSKYSGYMTVVYDPSKVKIATSRGAGTSDSSYGQILSQIAKDNNALVAMNAGGFYDPNWSSNGGIPHGMVIKDGKLLTNFRRGIESGGMIGFDEDNRLILKRVTAEEALNMKIRDAVDWGPYLIVDGVNYFKEENYRWACARTVIGQRKDGIVLLLVIDGSQPHSKGASYSDLADIMEKYGAYNAANLDGGTSTSMVTDNEYINIPFNGQKRTIRSLPNAWIVVE